MLPVALAGPRGVPGPGAGPRLSQLLPIDCSRPRPRLPRLCARAWCRQAKCDDLGAVCEAYTHSPSNGGVPAVAGGLCELYGPKMARSVPGLDGTWTYHGGNANVVNAAVGKIWITKGSGNTDKGQTCHVKGVCAAGWTSSGADNELCVDVDECAGVTCGGTSTCVDGRNKYTCECAGGWVGGGVGRACTDVDDLPPGQPAPHPWAPRGVGGAQPWAVGAAAAEPWRRCAHGHANPSLAQCRTHRCQWCYRTDV